MTPPGTPDRRDLPVSEVVQALAAREGEARVVDACVALLDGAPPETCTEIAVGLTGHGGTIDEIRGSGFREYWWPTWAARGLLYVWAPGAAPAVVRGLAHEHWRPAEMCMKVAARREIAEAADGAVLLAGHDLPRVRATALRLLGRAGDTEHLPTVQSGLDDAVTQVRRAAALALERMVARLDLPGEVLP